jgi:hypothetical protein
VDGRLRLHATCREGGEVGAEAVVLTRRRAVHLTVACIDDGDPQRVWVKAAALI